MFLTRPAVNKMYVDSPRSDSGYTQLYGPVVNTNGVTMGDIRSSERVEKEVAIRCVRSDSTTLRVRVFKILSGSRRRISHSRLQQTNKR